MEVTAQGMPYAEFKDNEYIESLVSELRANGTNVVVGSRDKLIWGGRGGARGGGGILRGGWAKG